MGKVFGALFICLFCISACAEVIPCEGAVAEAEVGVTQPTTVEDPVPTTSTEVVVTSLPELPVPTAGPLVCGEGEEKVIITESYPKSWEADLDDFVLRAVGYNNQDFPTVEGTASPDKAFNRYCLHYDTPSGLGVGDTACLSMDTEVDISFMGYTDCYRNFVLSEATTSLGDQYLTCTFETVDNGFVDPIDSAITAVSVAAWTEYVWYDTPMWEVEISKSAVYLTSVDEEQGQRQMTVVVPRGLYFLSKSTIMLTYWYDGDDAVMYRSDSCK